MENLYRWEINIETWETSSPQEGSHKRVFYNIFGQQYQPPLQYHNSNLHHTSNIVGFGQEGFFSLQDVTFMHLWCLIWSSIYNVRTDLIGSPGSSCLPDVLKLGFGPVFEEKSPHFLVLWRPLIMRMRKRSGNIRLIGPKLI